MYLFNKVTCDAHGVRNNTSVGNDIIVGLNTNARNDTIVGMNANALNDTVVRRNTMVLDLICFGRISVFFVSKCRTVH